VSTRWAAQSEGRGDRALGVVAAGHPLTAEAGRDVLRQGGNAVDAALAAMLTSFVAEPLLTGFGAGGYMLVGGPDEDTVLLDFFVSAPGHGADLDARAPLEPVDVSFGDANQMFNIGAASVGVYGNPSGICEASRRFGTVPLADLAAPAAALARAGVPLNAQQAYVFHILAPIVAATEESRALFMPSGAPPGVGDRLADPLLADALERLGAEGAAPFYTGDVAAAAVEWVRERGGMLTAEDLARYETAARVPVRVAYRGRQVLTNPPPSAGGVLLAYALGLLERTDGRSEVCEIVEVMERAQAERTGEFTDGLGDPGFLDAFMASRLGSTTHISVLDADGMACSVTCTNGEGSGLVVPGTGVHLNNMMGEQDLSPFGFFTHPPGRRLPSMMAPTLVLHGDAPELVLGSAGSNRIRSAILQVVLGVIDRGLDVAAAVQAPRVHFEDGIVYAEPAIDVSALEAAGRTVARFRDLNLFFGGCQAVSRDPSGRLAGAGDPRRGGVAVVA
jgi:gamma-glutamyltranspeptidase / glutathione hydrolase